MLVFSFSFPLDIHTVYLLYFTRKKGLYVIKEIISNIYIMDGCFQS
jgi:hypothetical protein